jgi:hypothetical protein
MSLSNFFNLLYDVAIILAVATFVLGFFYLYSSKESKKP